MTNGSGMMNVRLKPCCRRALADIQSKQEIGVTLQRLVITSPFLTVFTDHPADSALFLSTTDWDAWGNAVQSVPTIVKSRCETIAALEALAHDSEGDLGRFWMRLHESFGRRVSRAATSRSFATGFVNRFTSALSTDEDGMANALFRECGNDTDKVYAVFQELQNNFSTDADDVAQRYVTKLRDNRGSAYNALTTDRELVALLIRILDSGWTSTGEHASIRFLRSL